MHSLSYFFLLPFKAIEFNGVDITGFLKNFVVLMYLFTLVDFLKSYCQEKKNPIIVRKLYEFVRVEKFFPNVCFFGFDTFLAHSFEFAVFAFFLFNIVHVVVNC